jgi:RimJ/RimL family protein N-acetyltransferase
MNFSDINQELSDETLILKPISVSDREFINGMFQDTVIRRFYIVPKEAKQDYRILIDYWLTDNKNGAGTCWIIYRKGEGLFSRNKACGFIAFEFRSTLTNARLSYAILPECRRKGIATKSVSLVIERLKSNGVETIEADIDMDNLNSEKVVEKL